MGKSRYNWSILSARACDTGLAMGCVTEMENVFAQSLSARLLSPAAIAVPESKSVLGKACQRLASKIKPTPRRYIPLSKDEIQAGQEGSSPRALLVVGMNPRRLDMLNAIPDWRNAFDLVVAYLFDSFQDDWPVLTQQLDGVFVPIRQSALQLSERLGDKIHELPMAADVKKFGSSRATDERFISVNGYGRQDRSHLEALADRWNVPGSDRVVFHEGFMVRDIDRQRALFWQFLTHSQIALAYDVRTTQGASRFPYSLLSQRWFESLAAGCAVVGRRPRCDEADEILDWEDVTIELSDDTDQALTQIESLLQDTDRLDAIHSRNYERMHAEHDWRHRAATMLDRLGLKHTEPLQDFLDPSEHKGVAV